MQKNPSYLPSFSTQNTYISFEKALEFVGDNSQYQKRTIYFFSIQWTLFCFLLMGMPFLLSPPEFLCEGQSCDEISFCSSKTPKIDIIHSTSSISLDFSLFCSRKYYIGLCGFMFFLGSLFGGFIFPNISERKGRRASLLASSLLAGTSLILMGVFSNITLVILCFLCAGMAFNGFETSSVIYINEVSGERFRNFASMTMTVVWAFGQIIYSGLVYFIDEWRIICIAVIGIPFILMFIVMYKLILETPKFLISQNKYVEARIVLNQIALYNKRPQFTYRLEGEMEEFQQQNKYSEPKPIERDFVRIQSENYGYIDLFRYGSLRGLTICLLCLWFFRYFTYFGLAFSLPGFGGEIHENFLLTAVAELVACFMSGKFMMGVYKFHNFYKILECFF